MRFLGVTVWTGAGVTRRCFVVGEWAVKVPRIKHGWRHFLRSILANYSEREWTGFVPDAPGLPLNPVVWASPLGLVNVYRRARPYLDDPDPPHDWFGWFGDPKPQNLGWVGGELRLIDFDCAGRVCGRCVRAGHKPPPPG